VVLNAASGEPLVRALVRIEGDAETGALTDGQGRFEIPDVPTGPQSFRILKPGFRDASEPEQMSGNANHNVLVAAGMPELRFRLTPTASIRGQITLSTGDPALSMHLELLHQVVVDGRSKWRNESNASTDSEGHFNFFGHEEGDYLLYALPAFESRENGPFLQPGSEAPIERSGYASVFYPQAATMAGAEKIHLGSGDRAQANLTLTLEPFHSVTAVATLPHGRTLAPEQANLTAQVLDPTGQILPYIAEFNAATLTVQASLPDGEYTLLLASSQRTARQRFVEPGRSIPTAQSPEFLTGAVNFTLAGHPLGGLVIPLATAPANIVQLTVERSPNSPGAAHPESFLPINIVADSTGDLPFNNWTEPIAYNLRPGQNPAGNPPPGEYWLRVYTMDDGLCVQSLTAGGADLARERLHVGLNGAFPPIELVLRDDCAKLTLSLPPLLTLLAPGEEPTYTVYIVPAFDSAVNLARLTLRASSGGSATLQGLPPGPYRVYTFDHTVELEYHNPAALQALPTSGQSITLAPGGTANLVVEVPSQ
jgi:hypothetical protein